MHPIADLLRGFLLWPASGDYLQPYCAGGSARSNRQVNAMRSLFPTADSNAKLANGARRVNDNV